MSGNCYLVQITVEGDEALANVLNRLPGISLKVVAVTPADAAPAVQAAPLCEGTLVPDQEGHGGGTLVAPGLAQVHIPRARFAFLWRLVERPDDCAIPHLCHDL